MFPLYSEQYLALRGDGKVTVWDVETGKLQCCDDLHDYSEPFVRACCFSGSDKNSIIASMWSNKIFEKKITRQESFQRMYMKRSVRWKDPVVQMDSVGDVIAWVSDRDRIYAYNVKTKVVGSRLWRWRKTEDAQEMFSYKNPRIALCKGDPNILFHWGENNWMEVFGFSDTGDIVLRKEFSVACKNERIVSCCSIPNLTNEVFVVTRYRYNIWEYMKYIVINTETGKQLRDWSVLLDSENDFDCAVISSRDPELALILTKEFIRVVNIKTWEIMFDKNRNDYLFVDFDASQENTIMCVSRNGSVTKYNFTTDAEEEKVVKVSNRDLEGAKDVFGNITYPLRPTHFIYNGNAV